MSDGRISGRCTLGLTDRGGVRQASTSSSLSTVRGTNWPTSNRSVDPSSTPRPNHRPHGNLPWISMIYSLLSFFLNQSKSSTLTCTYGRSLRCERVYVRPSILPMDPSYHDQHEVSSKCPDFYAIREWIENYVICEEFFLMKIFFAKYDFCRNGLKKAISQTTKVKRNDKTYMKYKLQWTTRNGYLLCFA